MDEDGQVHIVADLGAATSEILSQDGAVAVWEFSAGAESDEEPLVADFEGYNAQEDSGGGLPSAPEIRRPTGVYTIGDSHDDLQVPTLSRRFRVCLSTL